MLPLGEYTVTMLEPHATLQGAVTWRNRATFQGVRIMSAILKIVFRHIFLVQLRSGGFRIVSDTIGLFGKTGHVGLTFNAIG